MIETLLTALLNFSGLQIPTLPDIQQRVQQVEAAKKSHNAKCAATMPEKTTKRMIFTYGLYNSASLNTLGLVPILLTPFCPQLIPKTASLWWFSATSLFFGYFGSFICKPRLPDTLQNWQQSYNFFYQPSAPLPPHSMPALSSEERYKAFVCRTPLQWYEWRDTILTDLTTRKGKALYYMGFFTPWLCTMLFYKLGAIALVALPSLSGIMNPIEPMTGAASFDISFPPQATMDNALSHQLSAPLKPTPPVANDPIPGLNTNICNEIFKCFTGRELLNAKLVSKSWYHALNSYLQDPLYSQSHIHQLRGLFFANLALVSSMDPAGQAILSISAPQRPQQHMNANLSAVKTIGAALGITSREKLLNRFTSHLTTVSKPTNMDYSSDWQEYLGHGTQTSDPSPTKFDFNQPETFAKLCQKRFEPVFLGALLSKTKVLDLTKFVPSDNIQLILQLINVCAYFSQPNFNFEELHIDARLIRFNTYREALHKVLVSDGTTRPKINKLVVKMLAPGPWNIYPFFLMHPKILEPFPNITLDFLHINLNTPLAYSTKQYSVFNDWLYDFPHQSIILKVGKDFWAPEVWHTQNMLTNPKDPSKPLKKLRSAHFIVPQERYEEYLQAFKKIKQLPPKFTVQLSTLEAPNTIETIEILKNN